MFSPSLALVLHPHVLGCPHTPSHSILYTVTVPLTLPRSHSHKRTRRRPRASSQHASGWPTPSHAPLPLPHDPHTTSASIHAFARYYGLPLRILASFRETSGMYTPVEASLRRIRGNASRLSPLPVLHPSPSLPPPFFPLLLRPSFLLHHSPLFQFLTLSFPFFPSLLTPHFPFFSSSFLRMSPPLLSFPSPVPSTYPSPSSTHPPFLFLSTS